MSGALSCVPVPEFWWLVIAIAFLIVAGKCQFCSTFASSAWKSGFSTYNFASRKRVQEPCVLFLCAMMYHIAYYYVYYGRMLAQCKASWCGCLMKYSSTCMRMEYRYKYMWNPNRSSDWQYSESSFLLYSFMFSRQTVFQVLISVWWCTGWTSREHRYFGMLPGRVGELVNSAV
jgi:hypothetical protein